MLAEHRYTDEQLIALIKNNDQSAFTDLYDQYADRIRLFVTTYLKSPQLSEDVCQEIFLKIWEGRHTLPEIKSFRAYIFTIARNHTLNILKKASTHAEAVGTIVRNYDLVRNATEEQVMTHDYEQFLLKAIQTLPPRAREVFQLCREHQYTYEEVAAILGISRNAVKGHMVHSLKILRDAVDKKLGISLGVFFALLAFGKN